MPVLTMIDITGTQQYIFSSNRLRESIGASEIVARATSWWVFDALRERFGVEKINLRPANLAKPSHRSPFDEIDENKTLEEVSGNLTLDAEVIYAGGGNTLILFAALNKAKEFTRHYTKKLLVQAPGLDAIIVHSQDFRINDIDQEESQDKTGEVDEYGNFIAISIQRPAILRLLNNTIREVNRKKANRRLSAPLLGMAVTAQCVSTGGVAAYDPLDLATNKKRKKALQEKYRGGYVSAETFAKLQMVDEAKDRLTEDLFNRIKENEQLKEALGEQFAEVDWKRLRDNSSLDVPAEFDDLGRTHGEASFIAIVHTDGNGMGRRIQSFGSRSDIQSNRDWVRAMRKFSKSIYETNLKALQLMTALLLVNLDETKQNIQDKNGKSFPLSRREEETNSGEARVKFYMPFRPLIFGGEDVAFVCDGRIALALTAYYLEELSKKTLPDGNPLYARAGVAIVKSHYPFKRAYDLAEDLAKSAKERINEIDKNTKQVAALDWHVAMAGLARDVREIRKHEYIVEQGSLNMRPVSLRARDMTDWRTWQGFERVIDEFQKNWKDKRNKIKALREALRGGKAKTQEFLKLHPSNELPEMPNCQVEQGKEDGWQGDRCKYFDAIEMVDFFFSLDATALQRAVNETQIKGGTAE